MQNFYARIHQEIPQADTSTPIFLRSDQIRLPKSAKPSEQNQNAIIRLAESVKRYGILEPLSVRVCGEERGYPVYELISGERRLRAAIIAGISKIPCIILPQDDKSCAVAGILSNLQKEGLNFFEQAAAFRMLMEDFSLTQEEVARKLGVSQSAVANKLRLLKLSREEQHQILEHSLTERHARSLLRLRSPDQRAEALYRIRTGKLNVAATERLIEHLLSASSIADKAENSPKAPISVILSPEKPPSGVCPRKFAIPNLTPLYNSIDRTLSIFRKTGATATCIREEGEGSVRIIIEIPRNA